MVHNYYNNIPPTLLRGMNRHGKYVLFVTGGIRDLTENETEEHPGYGYTGYGERILAEQYTAVSVIEALSDDMVLALNENDCEALIANFEDVFEGWKALRTRQINAWDKSAHVNSFTYGGVEIWLNQSVRSGLIIRFNAEKAMGHTSTTLWYGSHSFTLDLATAYQLIYALEVYASQCYDVTASHLCSIEKCSTVEQLQMFDYKVGYPNKLVI